MRHFPPGPITILRRGDFATLLKQPQILRDKLVIRLPIKLGLRTREVATIAVEDIDLDEGFLWVLDSKKYEYFPVPLDWGTAQLLDQQIADRKEGWLLRPLPQATVRKDAVGKALSNNAIQGVWRCYAKEAGLVNWNRVTPRLGRCYFIRDWLSRGGDIAVLCKITRHTNVADLWTYAQRLVFWEEIVSEFERVQAVPETSRRLDKSDLLKLLENEQAKQCASCPARLVCKYLNEAVQSEWSTGCKHYEKIIGELKRP